VREASRNIQKDWLEVLVSAQYMGIDWGQTARKFKKYIILSKYYTIW
jgi:hypothetical protein